MMPECSLQVVVSCECGRSTETYIVDGCVQAHNDDALHASGFARRGDVYVKHIIVPRSSLVVSRLPEAIRELIRLGATDIRIDGVPYRMWFRFFEQDSVPGKRVNL